jgi:hypothetical protein
MCPACSCGAHGRIKIDGTDAEFAIRTGARGALDLQVAPRVQIGVNGSIEFQSDMGVWRNPILLQEQPARRIFDETWNYTIGGNVRIRLGGTAASAN